MQATKKCRPIPLKCFNPPAATTAAAAGPDHRRRSVYVCGRNTEPRAEGWCLLTDAEASQRRGSVSLSPSLCGRNCIESASSVPPWPPLPPPPWARPHLRLDERAAARHNHERHHTAVCADMTSKRFTWDYRKHTRTVRCKPKRRIRQWLSSHDIYNEVFTLYTHQ
jgi:hypothetical protein